MGFFFRIAVMVLLIFVFLQQTIHVMMTRLSVNINKVATLRNARGGDIPNVVKVALDCETFGADGITVHPGDFSARFSYSDYFKFRLGYKDQY